MGWLLLWVVSAVFVYRMAGKLPIHDTTDSNEREEQPPKS